MPDYTSLIAAFNELGRWLKHYREEMEWEEPVTGEAPVWEPPPPDHQTGFGEAFTPPAMPKFLKPPERGTCMVVPIQGLAERVEKILAEFEHAGINVPMEPTDDPVHKAHTVVYELKVLGERPNIVSFSPGEPIVKLPMPVDEYCGIFQEANERLGRAQEEGHPETSLGGRDAKRGAPKTQTKKSRGRWPVTRTEFEVARYVSEHMKQYDELVPLVLEGNRKAVGQFNKTFGPTAIASKLGDGCYRPAVHRTQTYQDKIQPVINGRPPKDGQLPEAPLRLEDVDFDNLRETLQEAQRRRKSQRDQGPRD